MLRGWQSQVIEAPDVILWGVLWVLFVLGFGITLYRQAMLSNKIEILKERDANGAESLHFYQVAQQTISLLEHTVEQQRRRIEELEKWIDDHWSKIQQMGVVMADLPGSIQYRSNLTALRLRMTALLSDDELQTLCFDLDINYEDIGGESLTEKITNFLEYTRKRGMIDTVIATLERRRPDASWRNTDPTLID